MRHRPSASGAPQGQSLQRLLRSAWLTHSAVGLLAAMGTLVTLGLIVIASENSALTSLTRQKRELQLHVQSLLRRNEDLQTALRQYAAQHTPVALNVQEVAQQPVLPVLAAAPQTTQPQTTQPISAPATPTPAESTRGKPSDSRRSEHQPAAASPAPARVADTPSASPKRSGTPGPAPTPGQSAPGSAPGPTTEATLTASAPAIHSDDGDRPAPQASASAASPVTPVTSDQLDKAKNNPIEMVRVTNLSKLGIDRFDGHHVRMRSGTEVKVGQRFVSGETLLKADPVDRKIVTDKRTILVLD